MKELKSLNSEFSEFELSELEQRLETDPLAVGGLLDLNVTTNEGNINEINPLCGENDCTGINFG